VRRVGLFGGTFDPVHLGHLVPAVRAAETFRLDSLTFVPAGRPPHRAGELLTSFSHRFAMLALATHPYERFFVSDLELAGEGPTYTVDTLRRFASSCESDHLFFLMGSDSFSQIATWHRWEEIVELAHLIVLHRATAWDESLVERVPAALHDRLVWVEPFAEVADPPPDARRIYLLDHEPFPVSATHLRERLRRGQTIEELVPPEVHRYILKYRLYYGDDDGCDEA